MKRLSFEAYGIELAMTAALRSDDPYRKVGSCAMDKNNRVIGLAYNGTMAGFKEPEGFYDDRDERRKFMIHSEQNLVSLFKIGEAETVFLTCCPCNSCLMLLIAHGVKNIYYVEDYPQSDSLDIVKMYDINLKQLRFQ